jgi:hypothetical protein
MNSHTVLACPGPSLLDDCHHRPRRCRELRIAVHAASHKIDADWVVCCDPLCPEWCARPRVGICARQADQRHPLAAGLAYLAAETLPEAEPGRCGGFLYSILAGLALARILAPDDPVYLVGATWSGSTDCNQVDEPASRTPTRWGQEERLVRDLGDRLGLYLIHRRGLNSQVLSAPRTTPAAHAMRSPAPQPAAAP